MRPVENLTQIRVRTEFGAECYLFAFDPDKLIEMIRSGRVEAIEKTGRVYTGNLEEVA